MVKMKRKVVEPLNQAMRENLRRLQNFADSLAGAARAAVPDIEGILDGKGKVPRNCPDRNAAAGLALRRVEKKLDEVVAAVADIRQALSA